jgi:tetratricopeptide (TPR) repeat protein
MQRAVAAAPPRNAADAKIQLAIALRLRAEFLVQLGKDDEAEDDLQKAADLAEAAANIEQRDLLRMRRLDVEGQALLKHYPAKAVTAFSDAIELAKHQDSTYRAILHFKRADARRNAGDPHADDDVVAAMQILRNEVRGELAKNPDTASEPLWTPYFLRFRERQHELIESRITAGDVDGALVYAELARAFEPMQILLQADSLPPGFRFIETQDDLQRARANLPEDTVILQYLVLPERTYTWVVTRERIRLVPQRATKADIQGWADDVQKAVAAGQNDPFTRATRAAYAALFRDPLEVAGATKTRIVIVPDEPMQGLPFNALGSAGEGYLIKRASIATSGSMSLYLYALARDRELSGDRHPVALLVGDPAFQDFRRLPYARKEVELLSRDAHRHRGNGGEFSGGSEASDGHSFRRPRAGQPSNAVAITPTARATWKGAGRTDGATADAEAFKAHTHATRRARRVQHCRRKLRRPSRSRSSRTAAHRRSRSGCRGLPLGHSRRRLHTTTDGVPPLSLSARRRCGRCATERATRRAPQERTREGVGSVSGRRLRRVPIPALPRFGGHQQ